MLCYLDRGRALCVLRYVSLGQFRCWSEAIYFLGPARPMLAMKRVLVEEREEMSSSPLSRKDCVALR